MYDNDKAFSEWSVRLTKKIKQRKDDNAARKLAEKSRAALVAKVNSAFGIPPTFNTVSASTHSHGFASGYIAEPLITEDEQEVIDAYYNGENVIAVLLRQER